MPRARSQTIGQPPSGSMNVTFGDSNSWSWLRTRCVLLFTSHAFLVGRPNELVHLQLETHGQRVSDNFLDELDSGNWRLIRRHWFQGFVLLMRLQWTNPGEKYRADVGQF